MNIVLPFLAKFTRPIYKTSSLPPLFHHQQAQLVKPASSSVIDRVNRDQEHMVRWIRLGWLFEVDVVVAPSVAAATLVWQQGSRSPLRFQNRARISRSCWKTLKKGEKERRRVNERACVCASEQVSLCVCEFECECA